VNRIWTAFLEMLTFGRYRPRRDRRALPPSVAPWPSYCELPGGVRGVSFAYSWIHVADVEARVRECVRRGINLIGVELTACAETAGSTQVIDRLYWIARLGWCLLRASVWLAVCRKYRVWLKVTWGNDCRFPSPSLAQTREICAWAVQEGPQGLLLQPVVEAENAKALPWQEHYAAVAASGFPNAHCVDNRGGGRPPSAWGEWLSDFHPADYADRPAVVPSLVENDSPVNDWLMISGQRDYAPEGLGGLTVRDYYRVCRADVARLRELLGDCVQRGHGVIYWCPAFADDPDWAGIEAVGGL